MPQGSDKDASDLRDSHQHSVMRQHAKAFWLWKNVNLHSLVLIIYQYIYILL